MNVRAKRYLAVFSFYTAVNIFLLAKLRINGDLRADCTQNYIQSFHIWDFLIFAVFFGVVWTGGYAICKMEGIWMHLVCLVLLFPHILPGNSNE